MADDQLPIPTKFELNTSVDIAFTAEDVVASLGRSGTVALIEELDDELMSWQGTIWLARYFSRLAAKADTELLALSDDQLADYLGRPLSTDVHEDEPPADVQTTTEVTE